MFFTRTQRCDGRGSRKSPGTYQPWCEQLEGRDLPALGLGFAFAYNSGGNDDATTIRTDSAGNVYAYGRLWGAVDLDPGPGTTNFTGGGFYLTKYTNSGSLLWANYYQGWNETYEMTIDNAGYVYVVGAFGGTIDFDPGPGTFNLTQTGGYDSGFVTKVDTNGNFVWAANLDMLGSQHLHVTGIQVDAAGNVYIGGSFNTRADFDPGPGTFILNSGPGDIFAEKLDSNGNFVWAVNFRGSWYNNLQGGVAIDAAGNVYLAGDFPGTTDFDPGPGTFNLVATGGNDMALVKLDTLGNLVWAKQVGGTGGEIPLGIAMDVAGNLIVTGEYGGTVDFDPNAGVTNLTAAGGNDAFVAKYDTNGNLIWAEGYGSTSGYEWGTDIATNAAGDIYLTGLMSGNADFDPGPGVFTITSAGPYVTILDTNGQFSWAGNLGRSGSSFRNYSLALDAAGNIFFTGETGGDVDPSPAVNNTGGDIVILKLTEIFPATITQSGGNTTVTEAGGADTFTVVLNSAPLNNVILTFSPSAQVAVSTPTIAFSPGNWNTAQTISVTAVNDGIVEGPHQGTIAIVGSSTDVNFVGSIPTITASITDNDTAGITIAASGGSTAVAEGGATDTYTVVLNSQPAANVLVTLNPSSQLSGSASLLTFVPASWNVAQTVTVTAVNDLAVEGTHAGNIAHTASSGDALYNGIVIATLTAAITDNDLPQGINITPSGGTTNVAEAGGSDSYTVVLNSVPLANVVITLNGGTQLQLSASTLTFTPTTWNVAQTVVVMAVDDLVAEVNSTAVISHNVASSDASYNLIAIAPVTANIADNDTAGVSFTPTRIDLAEGQGTNNYSVVLGSQPVANVIVNIGAGSQVATSSSSIVFTPANWNVPRNVMVTAVEDQISEGLHSALIAHTIASADPVYGALSPASVTASITDNDIPGVAFFGDSMTILEGSTRTYTMVLTSPPTGDVTIAATPDSQLAISPGSVTFTPLDWNVPRPVVVTARTDGVEEGAHPGNIYHAVVSSDPAYSGISLASVRPNIVDSDGSRVPGTERNDNILVSFTPDRIIVTVNGKSSYLPGTLTQLLINAGGGNDLVQITTPTIPIVVVGGSGLDKVFVTGATFGNNFVLNDASVDVNGVSVGLWDIENATVSGKAGADTFTVQSVPAFPVELKGDVGNDVVIGGDRPNTWLVNTANGGTLDSTIKLTTLENWTGGAQADSFGFLAGKALSGRIDGGGGPDVLDYSLCTSTITVNLQTSTSNGILGFSNIGKIVGGKSVADKLIGANQSNTWNVTATNAGSVAGIDFANFENLTGGTLDDAFLLADAQGVKGKIDGGGGTDALDFSSYLSRPVVINLQTKTATSLGGFLNFEQFQGGSGLTDTLIGFNTTVDWNLTGAGAGAITPRGLAAIPFSNFENLTGGSGTDAFTLDAAGSWFGSVNGGTGKDVLTSYPGVNVWLSTSLTSGTLNGRKYLGIETCI